MDLCIDIGATKTFVAVFEQDEVSPLETKQFPTEPQVGFKSFLEKLVKSCEELLMGNQVKMWGVSTAGAVDENGSVLWSPNLGWKNFPLKKILTEFFGDNGVVENDCNAAAYAESWFRKCENLAYVTISTGIGMGLVIRGEIFHGSHFAAGEIGHTIVEEGGPVCSCGRRGCLQALVSGKGLENVVYLSTGQRLNCKQILKQAKQGAEPYQGIVLHAAQVLGKFLTNVVDILDLDILVLGGGLTRNKFYTDMVIKYIRQNYYQIPGKRVSVQLSKVRPNPGIIGVLLLAREIFGGA